MQVLFAFLLAVPFSNGYRKITHFEKVAFFVSLCATAVSSALLIATPFLFGKTIGIATAASFSVVVAGLWYGLPLWTKLADVRRARRAR